MKNILYYDDEVALYYDDETKVYSEYKAKTDEKGFGTSSYEAPKWFVRMKKINDIIDATEKM